MTGVFIPLMVTSGFRNRTSMCEALSHCAGDIIRVARPVCVLADTNARILDDSPQELPCLEKRSYVVLIHCRFIKENKFPCWLYGFAIEHWYDA